MPNSAQSACNRRRRSLRNPQSPQSAGRVPIPASKKERPQVGAFSFVRTHWARNTRFRSVMKLGTLYTTQIWSMPFSAAYWAGDSR